VPANEVMDFLQSYKTHPDVHKVNSALLAEFIRSMNSEGELTKWMVFLVGSSRDDGDPIDFGALSH